MRKISMIAGVAARSLVASLAAIFLLSVADAQPLSRGPVASGTAEATHILASSGKNSVYSVSATNLTATSGFLVLIDSAVVPADGSITPIACAPLSGSGAVTISYSDGPAGYFLNGVIAVLTSASTCFTKTTGVITGFISGVVQ